MLVEQEAPTAARPAVQGLPRRDWLLLPALSLATVLILLGVSEIAARAFWPAQESDSCFLNGRFLPNCVAVVKVPEGVWASDKYNDCGYRSELSCRSKVAGAFRIAVLGSSAAHGLYLPFEDIFPVKAGRDLHRQTGRVIDVQNLGIPNTTPADWAARTAEVLSLRPDAVLFTITPFDVEQITRTKAVRTAKPSAPTSYQRLERSVTESRAALVAQHYLFSNRERFLRFYLLYGDKADFLRQPLTPAWQRRYSELDAVIGYTADRLQAAHVPFYILTLPSRAEAALLGGRATPPGTDPLDFTREVAAIAARHHANYIDGVAAFARQANPESYFYVVDGHIKPEGQTVIAHQIAEAIHVQ